MTSLKEVVQIDLRYSAWATLRLLEACAELSSEQRRQDFSGSHGSIVNTLNHVYVSERFWIACLAADHIPSLEEMVRMPWAAAIPFDELVRLWPEQWATMDRWLEGQTEETLNEKLPLDIAAGKRYDTPRWQITRHVVNHGTLHRGQIVGMIRALSKKPPCVDYMEYQLRSRDLL